MGAAGVAKHEIVRGYGAEPLDGTDFVGRTARADAVFDPIGGAHWLRSYRCLRPGGRLVMFGAAKLLDGGPLPVLAAVKLKASVSSRSVR